MCMTACIHPYKFFIPLNKSSSDQIWAESDWLRTLKLQTIGKEKKKLQRGVVFSMILRRQLHIFCNHTHRGDLNVYGNPPQCKMTFIPQTVTCALFLPVSSATLILIQYND